jgi:hypothetical protein
MVGEPLAAASGALRVAGSVALAAGAAWAVAANGVGVGLVLWCGALTLAAVCIVLCLSYRPQWLPRLTWLGALGAIGGIGAAALAMPRGV